MEGHRLIIKRRIPKGRQTLLAVFGGALLVAGLVMIAQLKTTLSAHALAAVKTDVTNMRTQFSDTATAATAPTTTDSPVAPSLKEGESASPAPDSAQSAVEKFKKLLQNTPEHSP